MSHNRTVVAVRQLAVNVLTNPAHDIQHSQSKLAFVTNAVGGLPILKELGDAVLWVVGTIKSARSHKRQCALLTNRVKELRKELSTLPGDGMASEGVTGLSCEVGQLNQSINAVEETLKRLSESTSRHIFRQDEDLQNLEDQKQQLEEASDNIERVKGVLRPRMPNNPHRKRHVFPTIETHTETPCPTPLLEQLGLPAGMDVTSLVKKEGKWPVRAGGFGEVWRARYCSEQPGSEPQLVALKIIRSNGIMASRLQLRLSRETKIWASLNHRNILTFIGFTCHNSRVIGLVSPWIADNNIGDYLRQNPHADRCNLIRGIAKGMEYLHTRDPVVIHGDLKGANVLVGDNETPLLCDFGLSSVADFEMATASAQHGSSRWMAPERIAPDRFGLTPSQSRKEASDVFSLGMTALEILSGSIPFDTLSTYEAERAVLEGQRPALQQEWSQNIATVAIVKVIAACWDQQHSKRPSACKVMEMLSRNEDESTLDLGGAGFPATEDHDPGVLATFDKALPKSDGLRPIAILPANITNVSAAAPFGAATLSSRHLPSGSDSRDNIPDVPSLDISNILSDPDLSRQAHASQDIVLMGTDDTNEDRSGALLGKPAQIRSSSKQRCMTWPTTRRTSSSALVRHRSEVI